MRTSRIFFGSLVVGSVAIIAAPTSVMSQTTMDKMGQTAKGATHDATTAISDSWLTAKTKIALFADERVKGGQVSVETVDGTVALRGKVDSDDAKAAAGSVAKAVDGVKGVKNDLQVVPPGDRTAVDISDKDITRQVEDRVSNDARLKKVDVRTDGGVVMLTGTVGSIGASAHASEVARGVPGVRSVKNELTYEPAQGDRSRMTTTGAQASVMAVQQALKDKGFDPGPIDGVAGPRTTSALKEYQKSQNLTMTGTMNDDTAAKLGMKR
jgi:hyperosmotically inducible periplasmic protein